MMSKIQDIVEKVPSINKGKVPSYPSWTSVENIYRWIANTKWRKLEIPLMIQLRGEFRFHKMTKLFIFNLLKGLLSFLKTFTRSMITSSFRLHQSTLKGILQKKLRFMSRWIHPNTNLNVKNTHYLCIPCKERGLDNIKINFRKAVRKLFKTQFLIQCLTRIFVRFLSRTKAIHWGNSTSNC